VEEGLDRAPEGDGGCACGRFGGGHRGAVYGRAKPVGLIGRYPGTAPATNRREVATNDASKIITIR
jgi:hypothetical protein